MATEKSRIPPVDAWFSDYVASFRTDGALAPMLQMKLDHSLRVAQEMAELGADLGWPAPEIRLARCIGLLHDVGRFSQFREFNTYNDSVSVDHGERGLAVLQARHVLAGAGDTVRAHIEASVRYHNRKLIPADTPAESMPYLHLVRDADKLDILRTSHKTIRAGINTAPPVLLSGISPDGPISPGISGKVLQREPIDYADLRTLSDVLMLQLSWVFDLHYAPSFRRIRERRIVETIRNLIHEDSAIDHVFEEVQTLVAEKIG